jgi:hypothetical protein
MREYSSLWVKFEPQNLSYNNTFQRRQGVEHFITKNYYFEKVAYFFKVAIANFVNTNNNCLL